MSFSSFTPTFTGPPVAPPTSSGGGDGGGGGPSNPNSNLTNSASLYLYTFLATLVLLLSVSGAIVIRSFVLRRRHRLMVEEAMRNGTWVPPTPSTRPPRVDLSKKPALWEVYLGGDNWQAGKAGLWQGSGKELGIGTNWKFENSKDWESIKPLSADYAGSMTFVPYSNSTTNLPAVPIPAPTSITPGDEENQRTTEASTGPSLLTRAKMFFSPTSLPTSPLPASADDATTHLNRTAPTNISMTELRSSSPTAMRVAVLIAMPSPPTSSHGSSTALSSSFLSSSSSTSKSNVPQPTSHPLQVSTSQTLNVADDEHPLPVLEMGVAEVVLGSSEHSTSWDNSTNRRHGKATYSRGSSFAEP